jgi:carbamoyl-phosphate synthase large subunit
MGAGGAGAENLIRSLRRGDPSLALLGCNDDRFVLRHSAADKRALVPAAGDPRFVPMLRRLVSEWRIDLIVPTIDRHVQALSDARRDLRNVLFLPSARAIALCRDKLRLTTTLCRHGVPAPETHSVRTPDDVDGIFARMGHPERVWCRPRTGTCARGGAAVATPDEARRWMAVWETMQGVPASTFTLAEYLPGREILCQSIWRRGRMVLANTFERLAYFGTDNIPSGVTSLSSLAKTVVEPDVVEVCRRAIVAVAPSASGAFSVDVKEDVEGRPRITEINAGRFFMAMTAFDSVLKHSIAIAYVHLAMGERVDFGQAYDSVEDHYMVRDMDSEPGMFRGDQLFDGVLDVSDAMQFTVRQTRAARS